MNLPTPVMKIPSTRSGWWNITPYLTRGQAGKAEHVLVPGDIPVIQSDRGGRVTHHGRDSR